MKKSKNIISFAILILFKTTLIGQDLSNDNIMRKGKLMLQDVCEMTLLKNPDIKQSIWTAKSSYGSYQTAKSTFDWNFSTYTRQSNNTYMTEYGDIYQSYYGLDEYKTNTETYNAGISKSFRSGTRINPGVSVNRNGNNIPGNEDVTNSPSLDLSITQPLLKGMGTRSAAASLKAAELSAEAYIFNIKHTISYHLYSVVQAYWQYLSTYENISLYTSAEERAKEVLNITKALIDAGIKPAADLIQIEADVAEKTSQRINTEQSFFQAKHNLGRYIGLSNNESQRLPEPASKFPSIEKADLGKTLNEEELIKIARKQRQDIAMNGKITEAQKLTSNAYQWDKLPQLDIEGFAQFYGTKSGNKGDLSLLLPDVPAQAGQNNNVGFRLTYTMPIQNNLARGYAIQQLASYEQQRITEINQIRNMKIDVRISLNALGNYTAVLMNAEKSYQQYLKTYENEQLKFKQGLTTLLNLIQVQDRLTYAHAAYISAKLQFANALANLRYETGTVNDLNIISDGYDLNLGAIDTERFYKSPQK